MNLNPVSKRLIKDSFLAFERRDYLYRAKDAFLWDYQENLDECFLDTDNVYWIFVEIMYSYLYVNKFIVQ